jgi:hypothetical protein
MLPVASVLFGWVGIPHITHITTVTMVTKVAWGFPAQSLPRAEKLVGFHVNCPLLLSGINSLECADKF